MNKFSIIIFFMLTPILFSQTANMQLSQVKAAGDSTTLQLELILTGVQLTDNGLLVEMPADVSGIITGMTIGANNFWLKNTSEIPALNEVVHWDISEGRLVLRFLRNQLQDSDNLNIRITANIPRKFSEPETISVYQLSALASPGNRDQSMIGSTNLQVIE